jgi:hypothetical protein
MILITMPEDPGAFHGICYAAEKKFCAQKARKTINPVFLGQRFPKCGTQNNFRRNKDALFTLIDRYLFIFFMSIRKITGFPLYGL